MSYIAPGTSPAKIWSYATRTLTNHKRFLFIGSKDPVDLVGGLLKSENVISQSIGAGASASYTWTENIPKTGKIRVRVKAYIPGIAFSSPYDISLSIDGTQVASVTGVTLTGSYKVFIDYIGDITEGSHTFTVTITNGTGGTVTVYCYIVIANGIELSSTTPSTLLTASAPSYVLEVNGSFKYEIGIRYKIIFSPKTTTAISLSVNGETPQNVDLSAGNTDSRIGYGTCAYNSTITLEGAVGTTGDVVIITNLYVKPCLRGNQTYTSNNYSATVEMIAEEEGVAIVTARIYSLSGDSVVFSIYELQPNWLLTTYVSGTTTSAVVISGVIRPLANNSKLGFHLDYGNDSVSKSVIDYLLVVII